jgi:TonB family protein
MKVIQSWASICRLSAVLIAGGVLAAQETKPLPAPPTPGQAIQQAAQAAAHNRPKSGSLEVLTDTQGVDFGPYLQKLMGDVRTNWYELIPAAAENEKGKVVIEFKVQSDGEIMDMKLVSPSGDPALDRAAWGGIKAASPFQHLPSAFTGPHLALRFRFLYNPDATDMDGTASATAAPIVHAVLAKSIEDSGLPRYPKQGREHKVEGMVRLEAQIAPDGTVKSVTPLEGSLLLGAAASAAIRKWTFHPARIDGKAVADKVRINVEFRLDGEQVRAQVASPEIPLAAFPAP